MDVLSDVLKQLRVEGSVYARGEFTAPWGYTIEASDMAHFHVVARGSCYLQLAGEPPLPLAAGDLIWLPHGLEHALMDDPSTATVPWEEAAAGSQPTTAAQSCGGCPMLKIGGGGIPTLMVCGGFRFENGDQHPLLSVLPRVVHIRGEAGRAVPWLETTLRYLCEESASQQPGAETVITRLVDLTFVQVVRAWLEAQPVGEGGWLGALRDPSIGAALGLMHEQPGHPWTVGRLAGAVGLSRSGFAARFHSLVGMSPLQYLTSWRMQMAANQLRSHLQLSLAQVAHQVGYESEAAFSHAFKRHFQVRPGLWRRGG